MDHLLIFRWMVWLVIYVELERKPSMTAKWENKWRETKGEISAALQME